MIHPFLFVDVSGWFTLLWVPIITYSVLGIYSVAMELKNPFGTDLIVFDLDRIADEVVTDALFVHEQNEFYHTVAYTYDRRTIV